MNALQDNRREAMKLAEELLSVARSIQFRVTRGLPLDELRAKLRALEERLDDAA